MERGIHRFRKHGDVIRQVKPSLGANPAERIPLRSGAILSQTARDLLDPLMKSCLSLLAALFCTLAGLSAQIIYVDAGAGGSNSGTSWTDAYLDLQSALAAATAGDQIRVAAGTYQPTSGTDRTVSFELVDGVEMYGGFPSGGGPRNLAANETILSGEIGTVAATDNSYNVLTAGSGISAATILDGFTITAGYADGGGSSGVYGGGLYSNQASPSISGCLFRGNFGKAGGGIFFVAISSPSLTNCSFEDNSSDLGGGIYAASCSPTLTNCSFRGNSASRGGGVFIDNASVTLTNCSFLGNYASGSLGGGAIYNGSNSPSSFTNCSFQGNSAVADGGGIYINNSSPSLSNCVVWNNKDQSGSGTANASVFTASGTPTFDYSLIQGLNPAGTGNLDGTNPANDPLFVLEADPTLAPTTGGALRLLTGAPALDVGDNTANIETLDLAGNTRIQNTTIDLGAYEGNVDALFALLHPSLDPDADENGNGVTNYGDYAAGFNPLVPVPPLQGPSFFRDEFGSYFYRLSRRTGNALDVFTEYEKSSDLEMWEEMIEGLDYEVESMESMSADREEILLKLLVDPAANPELFWRHRYSSTPPGAAPWFRREEDVCHAAYSARSEIPSETGSPAGRVSLKLADPGVSSARAVGSLGVTDFTGAGSVTVIFCSRFEVSSTSTLSPFQWRRLTSMAPRQRTPSMEPFGQAFGRAGRSWTRPGSEETIILMITAGWPPLMSMLKSERWLCIEARLVSQKRFTRCLRQW